jgi:enoyl-CoA hydratase/carnithine racemase
MTDAVLYEQDGHVVTLTLNAPESRNALTDAVVDALVAACDRVNADMSVTCVIITGAGRGFCSGGDVKEMRARAGLPRDSPAEMRRSYLNGIQRIPLAVTNIEVPVIAAVNGHAMGAGLDLALMCDIRLAAEDARFAESFLRVGIISGDGGAWFLPRVIGPARANQMSFTADPIDAATALHWGLVSAVVPGGELMHDAMALARRIAGHPPHSLRMYKKLLRESQAMSLPASLELAAGMLAQINHTEDQREAVAAFFEKRTPVYVGR